MEFYEDNNLVEKILQNINNDLKKELSESRYKHSIGVMEKAEELAKIYGENINKAKLVGLAHDIGKELSKEEKLMYAQENNIKVDEIEKTNVGLLHGKIGADICKKRYGFTKQMQDAIEFHTTGNENMDLLAKIIFVADKIENGRTYKNEEKQKKLEEARYIANKNINLALLSLLDMSLKYTILKKELIHTDSIKTRNKIILKLRELN